MKILIFGTKCKKLPQPTFGILLVGAFPDLKMQHRRAVGHVECAEAVACVYFLSCFDGHFAETAVEGVVSSVLYEDALAVARHHKHLLHRSVEDALDGGVAGGGYVYTVVGGQLDVLVDRVIVVAELAGDNSLDRPRQLALVIFEAAGQSVVYSLFLLLLDSLGQDPFNLLVEGVYLLLLGLKVFSILGLALVEAVHQRAGLLLVGLHVVVFPLPLLPCLCCDHDQRVQSRLLGLQLGLGLQDVVRLGVGRFRQITQIGEAAVALADVLAAQNIHEPDFVVAVLVGVVDKVVVVGLKGVQIGLESVYLGCGAVDLGAEGADFGVSLVHQLLAVADLFLDDGQLLRACFLPAYDILELVVDESDFFFKLLLGFPLRRDILRAGLQDGGRDNQEDND